MTHREIPTTPQFAFDPLAEDFENDNDVSIRVKALIGGLAVQQCEVTSYVEFMNQEGSESIEARETLLENYAQFKPLVDELKARLQNHEDITQDASYLGEGTNSKAFTVPGEGKDYVVIIPHDERQQWQPSLGRADYRVRQLLPAKGVAHLEQIAAVSYEDGVTVSERIPGHALNNLMPLEQINTISQEQIDTLVDTVIRTVDLGIAIDPKSSNFIYDSQEGFGIIDFHLANKPVDVARALQDTIIGVTKAMHGSYQPTSTEDCQYILDVTRIRRETLSKFKTAVINKQQDEIFGPVAYAVDESIQLTERDIARYSDEQSVHDVIAENRKQVEEQKKREADSAYQNGWTTIAHRRVEL